MSGIAPLLAAALTGHAPPLAASAQLRLAKYADALLACNRDVNLTAARNVAQMLDILVLPSLGVEAAWSNARSASSPRAAPRRALDIGSGNGFPGVAVAILWPAAQVLLVERRAKKARAIESCLRSAAIENAEALACDAREVQAQRPDVLGAVDLVTVRAVSSLADATALAAPFLAPGGRVVHWKGENLAAEERAAGRAAARRLGLTVLPDLAQPCGRRCFVIYVRPSGGKSSPRKDSP